MGNSSRRGFTLVELLVAISIVALVSAVAFPMLGGVYGKRQRAEAVQKVAALVRTAAATASSRETPLSVYATSSLVEIRSNNTPLGADYAVVLPPGSTVSPQGEVFRFDERGRLVSGSTLSLNGKTLSVSRWGQVVVQ